MLVMLVAIAGCQDRSAPSPAPSVKASASPASSVSPTASASPAGSGAEHPGAGAWRQVERLAIEARAKSDKLDGDEVGTAVALSADRIVVGALNRARADGALSGAIALQRGTPSGAPREHREKSEQLGVAVGISGGDVLVGAPFADGRQKECGAVFAYDGAGTATKLIGSGARAKTGFGAQLAVSGTTAVVGQFASTEEGSAWVFSKGKKSWQEVVRLRPRDIGKDKGSGFGAAVAIDGDRVVVGAGSASVAAKRSGALWVFERIDGVFRETARVEASESRENLYLGSVVAVSGETIVASAGGLAPDTVYVFSRGVAGSWSQSQRLVAPARGTAFGDALAISGSDLLIGAKQARDGAGVVYAYSRKSGEPFAPAGEVVPREPKKEAWFGGALALEGGSALVGASLENNRAGGVYLFTR